MKERRRKKENFENRMKKVMAIFGQEGSMETRHYYCTEMPERESVVVGAHRKKAGAHPYRGQNP